MSERAVLEAGWGYWDITKYPYGGAFRRSKVDLECEIIRPAGRFPAREREVRFADGSLGVVEVRALKAEGAVK
jgi:hypothetical protein